MVCRRNVLRAFTLLQKLKIKKWLQEFFSKNQQELPAHNYQVIKQFGL